MTINKELDRKVLGSLINNQFAKYEIDMGIIPDHHVAIIIDNISRKIAAEVSLPPENAIYDVVNRSVESVSSSPPEFLVKVAVDMYIGQAVAISELQDFGVFYDSLSEVEEERLWDDVRKHIIETVACGNTREDLTDAVVQTTRKFIDKL